MVQQHQEQTLTEWVDTFELLPADIEFLTHYLLERETPLSTEDVALALFQRYSQETVDQVYEQHRNISLYTPKASYTIGQDIMFPMLDYSLGRVTATRDRLNADQGNFQVIQVEFQEGYIRDFASRLGDHTLNTDPTGNTETATCHRKYAPEEIMGEDLTRLITCLESQLLENEGFVRSSGHWFPPHLKITDRAR